MTRSGPEAQASPREAPADGAADGVARVPPALADAVGYALRLAQEASFAAYLRRAGGADLRPGRYAILTLIAANPGLTPTALARVAGRDKSTLTATLRDLETAHLIVRERDASDRRSYAVSLTPTGRDLLGRLRRHAVAHDAVLDAVVGPDKPALMAVLARITHALGEDGGRVVPLSRPTPRPMPRPTSRPRNRRT